MHEKTNFVSCAALLVAASSSGQGKTTVVAPLARLHTRLNLKNLFSSAAQTFSTRTIANGAPLPELRPVDVR